MMNILGIESSCDETAAAIVQDGRRLLSSVVHSQIDIHSAYGGVIPEVAARSHIEMILPVIRTSLNEAGLGWEDIDAIAVTNAPGLVGSLLVGTLTARSLAIIFKKPLYAINHVKAHIYANFITEQLNSSLVLPDHQPVFPLLALIVSGGHTQLMLCEDHQSLRLLGQTQDDAVGEAFDKVAKIIGLPYPGGPSIARAAEHGSPLAYRFPDARMKQPYDFSFSGLKTAVLRETQRICGKDHDFPSFKLAELLSESQRNDIAASFQHRAVTTLVDKTVAAHQAFSPRSVVIAGGVAANHALRQQLSERLPIQIEYAPIQLCTDNAAMIACLAYYEQLSSSPTDPYRLEVFPSQSIATV